MKIVIFFDSSVEHLAFFVTDYRTVTRFNNSFLSIFGVNMAKA